MTEKKYINGMYIKEKSFDNGGSVINISLKRETLNELAALTNDKGYINIVLGKRKEADQYGNTHYCYESDYKPKGENSQPAGKQNSVEELVEPADGDGLPF